MKTLPIFAAALALTSPALAAPKPTWQALADCSAAYQVNAAIKDPARPATMAGDMAAIGTDYYKAALHGLGVAKTSFKADKAVKARITQQKPRFTAMTREKLDKFIDACPQIEG